MPFIRLPSLTRTFSSTVSMAQARFSAGTDAASATTLLKPLVDGRWTLTKDGAALERQFRFKTFAKTWVSLWCSHYVLFLRFNVEIGLYDWCSAAVQDKKSSSRVVQCMYPNRFSRIHSDAHLRSTTLLLSAGQHTTPKVSQTRTLTWPQCATRWLRSWASCLLSRVPRLRDRVVRSWDWQTVRLEQRGIAAHPRRAISYTKGRKR